MSASPAPSPETPPAPARGSRVGRIVRWAARITSIPILALVLTSLVPALLHLSVAAREDKVMAGCLAGTAIGLLAGWRWAGLGGLLVLGSVGGMVSQNDGGPLADPFSMAFGLQGLLFLLSWALNQAGPAGAGSASAARMNWARKAAVAVLGLAAVAGAVVLFRGPEADPLPKGKEMYAGVWESAAGFKLEITPEGKATVSRGQDAKVEVWNLPASAGGTGVFNLTFRGDDVMELSSGQLGAAKAYHIDRHPRGDAKQTRMVLNGSEPYDPKRGMVLIKKSPGQTNLPPVRAKK